MPQGEKKKVNQEMDYDMMLAVINFTKATKHLLELLKIESLYDLEKQVLRVKVDALNNEAMECRVEKIEDLSESPI